MTSVSPYASSQNRPVKTKQVGKFEQKQSFSVIFGWIVQEAGASTSHYGAAQAVEKSW
jgi:hypothetical protein